MNTTHKPKKAALPTDARIALIHRTYWLAIGWGLFIGTMAWNYSSTAQHNAWVGRMQEMADVVKFERMMAEASAKTDVLEPPPANVLGGR